MYKRCVNTFTLLQMSCPCRTLAGTPSGGGTSSRTRGVTPPGARTRGQRLERGTRLQVLVQFAGTGTEALDFLAGQFWLRKSGCASVHKNVAGDFLVCVSGWSGHASSLSPLFLQVILQVHAWHLGHLRRVDHGGRCAGQGLTSVIAPATCPRPNAAWC